MDTTKNRQEVKKMNKAAMRSVMARNEDTQEKLAEALFMQTSALNARINGRIDFRANEICRIVRRYKLSAEETMEIFFDQVAS
jgi:plasmid maintenance system antidote protein VapI